MVSNPACRRASSRAPNLSAKASNWYSREVERRCTSNNGLGTLRCPGGEGASRGDVGSEPLKGRHRRLAFELSGREGDLHARGQEPCPLQRPLRPVGDGTIDQRPRDFDLSFCEAHEREARNRIPAELVGLAEDLLGAPEVAHSQPDLPDLVERLASGDVVEPLQLVCGVDTSALPVATHPPKSNDIRPPPTLHTGCTGHAAASR